MLARAHIDQALWRRVVERLPFLRGLASEDLERLRGLAVVFLHEKEMHGAAGLELTDDIRLSVALQACLPILNLGLDYYQGWIGIVVYPGEFLVQKEEVDDHGVVHSVSEPLSGEAWPGGPVVLSWEDVGLSDAGYNVIIHEFAHKLHMLHGDDGDFPNPPSGMDAARWRAAWMDAYRMFCAKVDAEEPTLLDPYAAEHPAEFFAVMSEAFFTDSEIIARDWADLYRQLARFYRQDPAGRLDESK